MPEPPPAELDARKVSYLNGRLLSVTRYDEGPHHRQMLSRDPRLFGSTVCAGARPSRSGARRCEGTRSRRCGSGGSGGRGTVWWPASRLAQGPLPEWR
jgi:hypothetical protein